MNKGEVIDLAAARKRKAEKDDGGIKKVPLSEVKDWSNVKVAPTKRTSEHSISQVGTGSIVTPHYRGEKEMPRSKVYKYDKDKQEVGVYKEDKDKFTNIKKVPATSKHEKDLKEASMKTIIDQLLEKSSKDAVQHYTKTYAKKDNIEQGRGKAGKDKVYNTEVKRPPKTGTKQEKERNIVTDRTTYNPKTGNITESTVGQPNLGYKHADSKEKKIRGGYPRTKREYGYNEATKSMIDQLLEKAITRPVSKMSNKEVEAYLSRKNREALSAPDNAIPEVTEEEKKVNALDQKRAIKLEQTGKSMDERTIDWLAKCHSHLLEGETEDSLKTKKKQPEKADGHTLGTDPAPRDEGEMVKKKEPDAWKSMISVVDELMEKARVAASPVRHVKLSPEREKEIQERSDKKLRALKQSTYKPDYSRYANRIYEEEGGKKSIDERTTDLYKDVWDDLKEQDRRKRHNTAVKHEMSRRRMNEAARKQYEAEDRPPTGYDHKPKEKSIDERTTDLFKDRESRRQIADAVRAVRLHREGMHKEAKKINPDPEKLATATWKHNAMIAASQREKSVLDTWKKDSSFTTKGSRVMPIGPGGEIQDLSKNEPPSYNEVEKRQDEVMSGKKERERKAKQRIELDSGAE